MLYDIYNPTRARRIFYDGIPGSQRRIEINPACNARVNISENVALELMRTPDDLIITEAEARPAVPLKQDGSKPIAHLIGHRGIGDTIHQRGPVKSLLEQGYEVYLETPGWVVYHDLLDKGLKLIHMPTGLHAQRRQIERECGTYQWHQRPRDVTMSKRFHYSKQQIDRCGSIAQSLYDAAGLSVPARPDFAMSVPDAWRAKAQQLIASWDTKGKPILIHRPLTVRPEWMARVRNPDPGAYAQLFSILRPRFFVVSVGFLVGGVEWVEGPEQEADVKLVHGELATEDLIGLWSEAALVYSTAGFGPVMAQAVGTPSLTIYGGNESFRTTERAGEHLAPSLGIDPDKPCDCYNIRCPRSCTKSISIQPARDRIEKFLKEIEGRPKYTVPASVIMREPPRAAPQSDEHANTLIFGTFYVDSADRDDLTELWVRLHTALNPECDFLAVDSQSPLRKFDGWEPYAGQRAKKMYFNFEDNIGHLSRRNVTQGRDGWGRAFTKGLEIASALKYSHCVHIEGDSLLRLKVADVVKQMKDQDARCFSVTVQGTSPVWGSGWVETGLMFFKTEYIERSNFIRRYDWPNRRVAPTPEVIVRNILAENLTIQRWKALRADKNQITVDNVEELNLDWVTHQHNSSQQGVYRKFVEMALRGTACGTKEDATSNVKSQTLVSGLRPESVSAPVIVSALVPALKKLNLGCGTNKIVGWQNHDADVDITKPLPFKDESASHIFIEHCVEHVDHKQAIAFFKEARRVLAPGGVLRVVVPSLEMIRKCDDPTYWSFTTKFQKEGPTKRGAMNAIIYAHGHQMIWCAALLDAALYYSGFDCVEQCAPGVSRHVELAGVEGHGRVIGDVFNAIESCVFEATKAGALAHVGKRRVAIVVGGGRRVDADVNVARVMCQQYGLVPEWLVTNDKIAEWGEGIAVTLHPDKLAKWLRERDERGHPKPPEIWCNVHQTRKGITHSVEDWRGSVGLFAVAVARRKGHDRIILCGVPMDPKEEHYLRPNVQWAACGAFQAGWRHRLPEIKHFVRSLSGFWTEELLGQPTPEWFGVEVAAAVAA